jgi:hypothetical protein
LLVAADGDAVHRGAMAVGKTESVARARACTRGGERHLGLVEGLSTEIRVTVQQNRGRRRNRGGRSGNGRRHRARWRDQHSHSGARTGEEIGQWVGLLPRTGGPHCSNGPIQFPWFKHSFPIFPLLQI